MPTRREILNAQEERNVRMEIKIDLIMECLGIDLDKEEIDEGEDSETTEAGT